jgi:hypothetical protein
VIFLNEALKQLPSPEDTMSPADTIVVLKKKEVDGRQKLVLRLSLRFAAGFSEFVTPQFTVLSLHL